MRQPPAWLRRARAPEPPAPATCFITGQPAKYREPTSRINFATAPAYRRLSGLPPAPPSSSTPARAPPTPVVSLQSGGFNGCSTVVAGQPTDCRGQVSAAVRRAAALLPAPGAHPAAPAALQADAAGLLRAPPAALMAMACAVCRGETGAPPLMAQGLGAGGSGPGVGQTAAAGGTAHLQTPLALGVGGC
jgi:hypothetical protein